MRGFAVDGDVAGCVLARRESAAPRAHAIPIQGLEKQ
jgi:hypothetical protein